LNNLFNLNTGASRTAGEIDSVFLFILLIGLFFFLVTQGALIYLAIKYRRRKGEAERETPHITGNVLLEAVWVVIPTVLILAIFYYGYTVFNKVRAPIPGASEVNVVGKKWMWVFKYPDGRSVVNELRVPFGKPVRLVMTSEDVIHGFFIPDYRLKQDVLPGSYTELWLWPDKVGVFDIYCSQYCGVGHSSMVAKLMVEPQAEYDEWLKAGKAGGAVSLVEKGHELVEKSGCLACHTLDGTPKVGPTLKGIFGRKTTLADGKTVTADESYIKESIIDPGAKVVKGFQPIMPTFKRTLSDDDITAIIAYLKTLK